MTIVALTGGIAAGKSTVSHCLSAQGALVIDADQIAREVVNPGSPALTKIVSRFGGSVLTPEGTLNRAKLGAIIFSDKDARDALNDIVHPAVRARSAEVFRQAQASEPDRVLVYAVPLVAESSPSGDYDVVVVVDAPAKQRISRLVDFRGMSVDEAKARVNAQATDDERRAIADVILDASGSLADTRAAADELGDALRRLWPDRLGALPTRIPSPTS